LARIERLQPLAGTAAKDAAEEAVARDASTPEPLAPALLPDATE
jgi:hypothetical protein